MIRDLVEDEYCKWCARPLTGSVLTRITPVIKRGEWFLYPVLCICGGITVIGAAQSLKSHINHLTKVEEE